MERPAWVLQAKGPKKESISFHNVLGRSPCEGLKNRSESLGTKMDGTHMTTSHLIIVHLHSRWHYGYSWHGDLVEVASLASHYGINNGVSSIMIALYLFIYLFCFFLFLLSITLHLDHCISYMQKSHRHYRHNCIPRTLTSSFHYFSILHR